MIEGFEFYRSNPDLPNDKNGILEVRFRCTSDNSAALLVHLMTSMAVSGEVIESDVKADTKARAAAAIAVASVEMERKASEAKARETEKQSRLAAAVQAERESDNDEVQNLHLSPHYIPPPPALVPPPLEAVKTTNPKPRTPSNPVVSVSATTTPTSAVGSTSTTSALSTEQTAVAPDPKGGSTSASSVADSTTTNVVSVSNVPASASLAASAVCVPVPEQFKTGGSFMQIMRHLIGLGHHDAPTVLAILESWRASCPVINRLSGDLGKRVEQGLLGLKNLGEF